MPPSCLKVSSTRRRPRLVAEHDHHAPVQVALGLQPLADQRRVELRLCARRSPASGVKVTLVPVPRALPSAFSFEVATAARVGLHVVLAVALDPRHQLRAERVHHRGAHAVQAARVDVVALLELSAGVQRGEDDLQRRLLVLRHHVHGDAAAVVVTVAVLPSLCSVTSMRRGVAVDHLVDRVVERSPRAGGGSRWRRCRRCTWRGACAPARAPRGPGCRAAL